MDSYHTSGSLQPKLSLKQLCSGIVLLGFLATRTVSADPDLNQFNLVFGDDFNGTELDNNKWVTGYLWGPYLPINEEEQLYVDTLGMHRDFTYSPFEFTGSTLKITATPVSEELQPPVRPVQDDPIWRIVDNMEYRYNGPTDDGPGYQPENVNYLSGIINSYNAFSFTHGYVEARMKLPAGQGLFPAFWTNTSRYIENFPEIDIMEFVGNDTGRVYHNYHYFDPNTTWTSAPSFTTFDEDVTQTFHTFGMEWSPTEIVWYVDGNEAHRVDSSQHLIANQDVYLIANLAVGGIWPGSPDATTQFPAALEIDYIRAYKRVPIENQPPVAVNDSIGPIDTGSTVTFSIVENDTDDDGQIDANSVTIINPPESGTVEVAADGQVTYTHDGLSIVESDSFTYTVLDNSGDVSNEATVTIAPIEKVIEANLDLAMIEPVLRDWSGEKKSKFHVKLVLNNFIENQDLENDETFLSTIPEGRVVTITYYAAPGDSTLNENAFELQNPDDKLRSIKTSVPRSNRGIRASIPLNLFRDRLGDGTWLIYACAHLDGEVNTDNNCSDTVVYGEAVNSEKNQPSVAGR